MLQELYQHTFGNGLTLLAERMEHVRSAAMYLIVPGGCAYDPLGQLGLAGVLADLITRGAGDRDNRELTMAMDRLGLDHSESAGLMHIGFWGNTMARNLPAALRLLADIVRRPHFPEPDLDPVKALAIQDLKGLEDEPGSRVMVELRKHLYPAPQSNHHRGTLEGVEALTLPAIREHYTRFFRPGEAILAVAGNIDWPALLDLVGSLFADWQGAGPEPIRYGPPPGKRGHLDKEQEQTQITVAYRSVAVGDPDYYAARAAVGVLGGGASRLFNEIREKEGLCYSVGASYLPMKERGDVFAYAASTNDRAQRTLDKLIAELKKLPEGVTDDEMEQVRVGLKTSLIMQQESTSSRATSLASEWYNLGRVRRFDEIQSAIEGLSVAKLLDHVRRYPPGDFSIVTLGPKELHAPS